MRRCVDIAASMTPYDTIVMQRVKCVWVWRPQHSDFGLGSPRVTIVLVLEHARSSEIMQHLAASGSRSRIDSSGGRAHAQHRELQLCCPIRNVRNEGHQVVLNVVVVRHCRRCRCRAQNRTQGYIVSLCPVDFSVVSESGAGVPSECSVPRARWCSRCSSNHGYAATPRLGGSHSHACNACAYRRIGGTIASDCTWVCRCAHCSVLLEVLLSVALSSHTGHTGPR
jgi:hypothetical protein